MLYREIRERIRESVEGVSSEKISLEEVQESKEGDFSFKTFRLGKKLGKNPEEIAKEIVKKTSTQGYIKKIEAKGPYVNFFLDYGKIFPVLLKGIEDDYGKGKPKEGKIILEHTSINPSGPVHVGRLRNSLIGDALGRTLKFSGCKVEIHFYVNDIGKQIAIIAQGYKENIKADEDVVVKYKEYKDKEDFQVFFEYVAAYRKFQEDEEFQKRVQGYIQLAESGDKIALNKIRKVAEKCLEGQKETFERLGIKFDSFDFESKYLEDGSVEKILESLKKEKEVVKETDDGCFGLDLGKFGLQRRGEITVLARKDGTSVYLSRDLGYHLEKEKLGERLINILGEDHKFEFLELKTILENFLNLSKPLEVVHYAFVNFEGGELSTRKGLIAPVDRLINEAIEKAGDEIEKRKIAERKKVAPMIGIGAIKYHILKTSAEKPITFRWGDVLNFEGEASPYIQYAHARCCSIIRKVGEGVEKNDLGKIENLEEEEKTLFKDLMKFPSLVEKAAQELKPHLIANFLYRIAANFSRFYKKCQVLGVEKEVEERRLLLVDATRVVIKNGLYLLGIEAPEKM